MTGFGSLCQPATAVERGEKKRFQAYLLQACVTNDCFVPLTQWGGLSQASCSSLAGVWVLASWHVQKFDKKKTSWQHFHEYLNSLPFKQQSVKWGRQHAASVSDLSRFQAVPGFWLRRYRNVFRGSTWSLKVSCSKDPDFFSFCINHKPKQNTHTPNQDSTCITVAEQYGWYA